MNALVLSLALTSPAHPPAYPPPPPAPIALAPRVVVQPTVVVPAYRPPVVVVPQPPAVVAPPAVTLGEFSRWFAPTPGRHDVWVVHPATGQPVKVCFALPPGRLKEFEVTRRAIRFEFAGGREVEIEFRNNGTVRVEYDN